MNEKVLKEVILFISVILLSATSTVLLLKIIFALHNHVITIEIH